jgi:hypothetical protein
MVGDRNKERQETEQWLVIKPWIGAGEAFKGFSYCENDSANCCIAALRDAAVRIDIASAAGYNYL